MSELHILEFDGADEEKYLKVNAQLGLDSSTGAGDWPAGLITHLAGLSDTGNLYVIEVWESKQAQEDFMQSRLGPALAATEVTTPPKISWAQVLGQHHPGL
ncbi:MAG TPA: hypothetical protein PKX56_00730 [Marmoricola sp.]|nr:hypothetical protein [Marmoricola sp.]HNI69714.1 hypothetical protein [Marmoricola sp.]HNJ77850.1 hypothetical protein [Marmoricola sp.]HNN47554.1 hypothetical protein [Marmoricola sp.]HNO39304.1 hypothetical protein [Marmoricola sp.]